MSTKTWIVARHEFATTVKRWGFLLLTFGVPLLMAGIMILSTVTSNRTIEAQIQRRASAHLFVVDESALFPSDRAPAESRDRWTFLESRDQLKERIRATPEATGVLIPADYLENGTLVVETSIPPSFGSALGTLFDKKGRHSLTPPLFQRWMETELLRDAPEAHRKRSQSLIEEETVTYLVSAPAGLREESALEHANRFATGLLFFFVLFGAIATTGGYLIQGVVDEKENRVLEIVVSSVTPSELMMGKLLGLGGAGLLQLTIWSVMGVFTALQFVVAFVLNPATFVYCALFFFLGYFFFGSLMLGIGSLGANARESSQYTAVISIFSILPLYFFTTLLAEPQGTLARVFSYIPFTAPSTMMMRITVDPDGTPRWEIAVVLLVLLLSTWFAVRMAARLYRAGLLLYGKRPTPREIWRWLRAAEA